ncbi:MAG TPA: CDP-alcohol phosphatidyltransferase family protein [Gemmatimonadaceae bacterium]|nr:CDP-alcohol phosphatidyltransferase family protein [Gemmatimonadaceae bacterium]
MPYGRVVAHARATSVRNFSLMRAELRRLPNVLSLSRLLLAALFIPAGQAGRVALICLAAITDFLDGWLARRTNTTTRWGAIVDPIADRIFVLVAVVAYVLNGALSPLEALLLLPRDIATALAFLVAQAAPKLRAVEFKARFPGKLVTVLQLVTLLALVLGAQPLWPYVALVALASAFAIGDYTQAVLRARAR